MVSFDVHLPTAHRQILKFSGGFSAGTQSLFSMSFTILIRGEQFGQVSINLCFLVPFWLVVKYFLI